MSFARSGSRASRPNPILPEPADDTPRLTLCGVLIMTLLIGAAMVAAAWVANAGAAALDLMGQPR